MHRSGISSLESAAEVYFLSAADKSKALFSVGGMQMAELYPNFFNMRINANQGGLSTVVKLFEHFKWKKTSLV